MLPIAAGLGYATSVIHIYGMGPYIEPISSEFGWSRTLTTSGLTLATLVQAVASVPIGLLVDRVGPRWIGLIGVVLTCGAMALIGTATGSSSNWYALWTVMAFASMPVQATIWTSAVATRFETSRGLALAVTLCGASVAAALFPWFATRLILAYGWKTALMAHGGLWLAIALPMILLFFRGARDQPKPAGTAPAIGPDLAQGASLGEGMRSTIYLRLLLTSLLLTFTLIALLVHFIPIQQARGVDPVRAASIAALIGIFSIVGRLATGFLLDRFRASIVGAITFLLPAIGCLVLLLGGTSDAAAIVAATLIGLTLGAEIDVVVYLTTRHFGLRSFGALYGGLLFALSIGTALGPLAASLVFDLYGNYAPFLWLAAVLMLISSLALATLPRPQTVKNR